jgi:hypothetical protein
MCGITPDVWGVLQTGSNNSPLMSKQVGWLENIPNVLQNTQPLRSLFRKRSNVTFPRKITRKKKPRILRRDKGLS